jgi:hypothetical protein
MLCFGPPCCYTYLTPLFFRKWGVGKYSNREAAETKDASAKLPSQNPREPFLYLE